ncbi:MAG: hypothetical protein R6W75_12095, partial [Smithellaceae bacterium]
SKIVSTNRDKTIIDKYLLQFHELMNDVFDIQRQNISYLLSELADLGSKEILEKCLEDTYLPVRYNGIIGLARLYNKIDDNPTKERYLKIFFDKYKMDEPENKMAAIEAMGIIDYADDAKRKIILSNLYNKDSGIKKKALNAIPGLKAENASDYLLDMINDDDEEIIEIVKKNLRKMGWNSKENRIHQIKPTWCGNLNSWDGLADKFIEIELQKNKPNYFLLSQSLVNFQDAYKHGAWIKVAQVLHTQNRIKESVQCYIEAVYCDPDPNSVAWLWLSGNPDNRMNYLNYNDKPSKDTASRLRTNYGFSDFKDQKGLYNF